jgi:hypothetical protein
MAVDSILRQMGQRQQLQQLPDLLARLQNQVDTNLTQSEALSLLAATLQQSSPVRFSALPLKPAPMTPPAQTTPAPGGRAQAPTQPRRPAVEPLRQLDTGAGQRWPERG